MKPFPGTFLGLLAGTLLSHNGTLLTATANAADAPAGSYHLLKEIAVGGEGNWDYLSVDPAGRRLYVSHGSKVVVIDVLSPAVRGS